MSFPVRQSRRPTLRLWALLASVAAHGLFIVSADPGARRKPAGPPAPRPVQVALTRAAPRADAPPVQAPPAGTLPPVPPVPPVPHRPVAAPGPASPSAAAPIPPRQDAPAGLMPPASPRYYPLSALNEKPRVQVDLPPELALLLSGREFQFVNVTLLINETGGIDQALILESNFPEENRQRLVRHLLDMRFSPGKIAGAAVGVEMRIEIALEPGEDGPAAAAGP